MKKIDPFVLTMPDNGYWRLGANVGKAWVAGKTLKCETGVTWHLSTSSAP